MPAVGKHLTAKKYVGQANSDSVNESLTINLDPIGELKLELQYSIFFNSILTSPKLRRDLTVKAYVITHLRT